MIDQGKKPLTKEMRMADWLSRDGTNWKLTTLLDIRRFDVKLDFMKNKARMSDERLGFAYEPKTPSVLILTLVISKDMI